MGLCQSSLEVVLSLRFLSNRRRSSRGFRFPLPGELGEVLPVILAGILRTMLFIAALASSVVESTATVLPEELLVRRQLQHPNKDLIVNLLWQPLANAVSVE